MELTELSEICLRKLFELGNDYTNGKAFRKLYTGSMDAPSIKEYLEREEAKSSKSISLKLKRKLVMNEDVTFNSSETFQVSLRLMCAQCGLGRLCQRSYLESHLVPLLPTDQTNEALLWATTNFWNFHKCEFLGKYVKVEVERHERVKPKD